MKIEYLSKKGNNLITLIVHHPNITELDLIASTDKLYSEYKKRFKKIEVYYFQTKESAMEYVYLRFVKEESGKEILSSSDFAGKLVERKLFSHKSPTKLIRTYKD